MKLCRIVLVLLIMNVSIYANNIFTQKQCPVLICDFGKNFEFRYPIVAEPKIEKISGVIKVDKKMGIVSLEDDSGKFLILTNDKKFVSKDGSSVSWNEIKKMNGKRICVSGILNEETNIFTVIKYEKIDNFQCL